MALEPDGNAAAALTPGVRYDLADLDPALWPVPAEPSAPEDVRTQGQGVRPKCRLSADGTVPWCLTSNTVLKHAQQTYCEQCNREWNTSRAKAGRAAASAHQAATGMPAFVRTPGPDVAAIFDARDDLAQAAWRVRAALTERDPDLPDLVDRLLVAVKGVTYLLDSRLTDPRPRAQRSSLTLDGIADEGP